MKHKTKKIKIIFLAIIFFAVFGVTRNSQAEITSVSEENVSHGESITISGNGFGVHADNNEGSFTWNGASPINAKFKDFEDNNLTSGEWGVYENRTDEWSVNVGGKTNSNYYGHRFFYNDRPAGLQYYFSKFNSSGKLYVSFYFMMPNPVSTGKMVRIYGSTCNIQLFPLEEINRYLWGMSTCGGSTQWSSPNTFGDNTWHRVEVWLDQNEAVFTTWLDGVQQWTKSDYVPSTFNADGHTLDIGEMIDEAVGSYNYDDIYVDYAKARIEICNSDIWANRTHCEVQIPTTWNDASVSVNINQGSFADDENVYLFVIDENGTVSNGYGINFASATPDTTPPSHPTGLSVN